MSRSMLLYRYLLNIELLKVGGLFSFESISSSLFCTPVVICWFCFHYSYKFITQVQTSRYKHSTLISLILMYIIGSFSDVIMNCPSCYVVVVIALHRLLTVLSLCGSPDHMVKFRAFIFGTVIHLWRGYSHRRNYSIVDNILKIINF